MKKLISFLALSFCALTVNAQATHNMKITFQDGNTVVYGMENVKTVEFVEKEEPSAKETYTINGVEYPMPEAVDLGLPSGTKWANMDLGSFSIYERGQAYGWADPQGNHKVIDYYYDNPDGIDIKWDSPLFGGNNPPSDISGTDLDIVNVNLKNGWVLPTIDDFKELIQNCSMTYVIYNNIHAINFLGPNGNSIFIFMGGTVSYGYFSYTDSDNPDWHIANYQNDEHFFDLMSSTLHKHPYYESSNYPFFWCVGCQDWSGFVTRPQIDLVPGTVCQRNIFMRIRPVKK